MPNTIMLIGWDNTLGPFVEAKYPDKESPHEEKIASYLTAIQSISSGNTIEISAEEESVLLYGMTPSSKMGDLNSFNYKFILLALNKSEIENMGHYKSLMSLHSESIILESSKNTRLKLFESFALKLFKKEIDKITFLGFPNAGKTSTKYFIFEKMVDEQILNTTIEPTQSVDISYYSMLDTSISLFDASGQSLNKWFNLQEGIVPATNILYFFFSIKDWLNSQDLVIEKLNKLNKTIEELNEKPQVLILCHKLDLYNGDKEILREEIENKLSSLNWPIFLTSIKNGGNQDLIIAIQLLFEKFSETLKGFNEKIKPIFKDLKIETLLLLDSDKNIIADFVSDDSSILLNESVKNYTKKMIMKLSNMDDEPISFFNYQNPIDGKLYGFLNFQKIFNAFSYVVFTFKNYLKINQLLKEHEKMIKMNSWQIFQS